MNNTPEGKHGLTSLQVLLCCVIFRHTSILKIEPCSAIPRKFYVIPSGTVFCVWTGKGAESLSLQMPELRGWQPGDVPVPCVSVKQRCTDCVAFLYSCFRTGDRRPGCLLPLLQHPFASVSGTLSPHLATTTSSLKIHPWAKYHNCRQNAAWAAHWKMQLTVSSGPSSIIVTWKASALP